MILAVVVGLVFGSAGIAKLANVDAMAEAQRHLGFSRQRFALIGGLEALGAAGVLVGLHGDLLLIALASAVGLIALTIGAGYYHQRAGDPFARRVVPVIAGSLAIFYAIAREGAA